MSILSDFGNDLGLLSLSSLAELSFVDNDSALDINNLFVALRDNSLESGCSSRLFFEDLGIFFSDLCLQIGLDFLNILE